jgi:hypothetical protein
MFKLSVCDTIPMTNTLQQVRTEGLEFRVR